jgi:hypothetical protein
MSRRSKPGKYEIVDSLGTSQHFIDNHFSGMKTVSFNTGRLQPQNSSLCGMYAVFCGIQRLSNEDLSLRKLLSLLFSVDLKENDRMIQDFFETD